jgi:predicted dehydrogenase
MSDMTMAPVRAILIGTGNIARAHVTAVRDLDPRISLTAALDIDAARVHSFCQEHGIPHAYTDVDALLEAERPDVALIATPPGTHADLCVRCMDAGAWVLCEKPLCASLAEMDRIEATERRTGRYTSSVFQWRFGSGGQHLKRLIESNALGRTLVCNSLVTWYRGDDYYAVPWRGKWTTELGGTSMGHGIHAMDFVLWLLGEWTEVRALVATVDRAIEVEDTSMAIVRFANGAVANMTNSTLCPRESSYVRFDFQKATVELTHLYRYRNDAWRYSGAPDVDAATVAAWAAIPTDVESGHRPQLAAFLDSLATGVRPAVSGADVRRTLEFLASLYKSGMSGLPVQRGSIRPDDPFYHRMCGPCDGAWQRDANRSVAQA